MSSHFPVGSIIIHNPIPHLHEEGSQDRLTRLCSLPSLVQSPVRSFSIHAVFVHILCRERSEMKYSFVPLEAILGLQRKREPFV